MTDTHLASLRLSLQEQLTAAENLLAAIEDATGQFDAECAALDTACVRSRTILQTAGPISVRELLSCSQQIALIWSVDDVLQVRPDLTTEQAWAVLQQAEHRHDAMLGVSWDTLAIIANELFGPAPDTDAS